jgi:hypothetical protein
MGVERRVAVAAAAVAAPVAHRVDVVGDFEQAHGFAVGDQHALHAQAERALSPHRGAR